mgnify:CR=1 FL=1
MPTVTWNGVILAESDQTEMVEGNHYFPPDALNKTYFQDNARSTTCPWKGKAGYYDIVVNGRTNTAAAWTYPDPKPAAKNIAGYVAFYKNKVTIEP